MPNENTIRGGNCNIEIDPIKGVAIKRLRNTSSKEKVFRFKRELDVLQKLKQKQIPNIVDIYDVYIDENDIPKSYIEMKIYDGSLYDLFDITKGNVKLSLELILPIIKTLNTLSKNNPPIYHRDLKPDNILYLKEKNTYTLFLADFGTCFLKDGNERLTPIDIAVGPRMFIAPEYETGRVEEVTEKGDIFSIGKVIWAMINGTVNEFMPSNFWFIDEYNLTKRFPGNHDIIMANTIIASCLNINPQERCTYENLISQIQTYFENPIITNQAELQLKVKLYQEKRNYELLEIKEKNRLLVNYFSQCYIKALEHLQKIYPDFDIIQILLEEYRAKSKDGINYTTINVENNTTHYLYNKQYDRFYLSINYDPAKGNERYCTIYIEYHIANITGGKRCVFQYSDTGSMVCKSNTTIELLTVNSIIKFMNSFISEYVA